MYEQKAYLRRIEQLIKEVGNTGASFNNRRVVKLCGGGKKITNHGGYGYLAKSSYCLH
jgi:hypothetical protein